MTKRLNISIPDNLYQKLKETHEKINVSKICQAAIKKAIEKQSYEITTA